MAENHSTSTTLAGELAKVIAPSFGVTALLQGAMSLLVELEGESDPHSNRWAAQQLIEQAWSLTGEIHGDREYRLLCRLEKLDAAAAQHQNTA
jgi:hypothetical protein